MHIHLDPLGGIAGDMFLAAVLNAWPELTAGTIAAARAAGLPPEVALALVPHTDHALAGARLRVAIDGDQPVAPPGRFGAIADRLAAAPLAAGVRDRALAIFTLLAEAEADVHGIAATDVVFHELAGWDSIADIVGAAHLIEALAASGWSVGPLPLGSGRVDTAHGPLPVPAPATAKLLEGFPVIDDGVAGERVTPTGAAILRHLAAAPRPPATPLRLARSGTGFGTRTLPGLSNALRLIAYDDDAGAHQAAEPVGVIGFEVDDQTPEDLAVGLDALRARDDVVDVIQLPAFGKKGRMVASVQVLCRPAAMEAVIDACFHQTSTIGLRWAHSQRTVLPRRTVSTGDGAVATTVKVVTRPDRTRTAKAGLDDVRGLGDGHAARQRLRRAAEDKALRDDED